MKSDRQGLSMRDTDLVNEIERLCIRADDPEVFSLHQQVAAYDLRQLLTRPHILQLVNYIRTLEGEHGK